MRGLAQDVLIAPSFSPSFRSLITYLSADYMNDLKLGDFVKTQGTSHVSSCRIQLSQAKPHKLTIRHPVKIAASLIRPETKGIIHLFRAVVTETRTIGTFIEGHLSRRKTFQLVKLNFVKLLNFFPLRRRRFSPATNFHNLCTCIIKICMWFCFSIENFQKYNINLIICLSILRRRNAHR